MIPAARREASADSQTSRSSGVRITITCAAHHLSGAGVGSRGCSACMKQAASSYVAQCLSSSKVRSARSRSAQLARDGTRAWRGRQAAIKAYRSCSPVTDRTAAMILPPGEACRHPAAQGPDVAQEPAPVPSPAAGEGRRTS